MAAARRRGAPGATLGRAALAALFALARRVAYDVHVAGVEHDPAVSPTCYAFQHKRDFDPIAPLPSLIAHRGWRALAGDLRFPMRADAFAPGFLARIVGRPRWLAFVVRPLSVGPLLRWLGVYPLESPRLRPAEHWIRDALPLAGDRAAGQVVASWQVTSLAMATGESAARIAAQPLSRLLAWRYQPALQGFCGADILNEPWRGAVRREVVAGVHETLAVMSSWLGAGGSLFCAPEGQLSPDGHLSPVSAGFHRIVRGGPARLTIVPVVVTYDTLTTARARIFVDVGQPFETASSLAPTALDDQVRAAWLRAGRFTTSQLASAYVVERSRLPEPAFTLDNLASTLTSEASQLCAAGRHVDEHLLTPAKARTRARAYLRFANLHGIVHPTGAGRWVPVVGDLSIAVAPREVGYRAQPLAYAYNEWRDLMSLDAPAHDGEEARPPPPLPMHIRPSP
jgi:hypothetical protein